MTIQYCSDLHLEFPENRTLLARNPITPTGDILILAGDIIPFGKIALAKDFIDFASDHFSAVYWLPGNHEYYGSDIAERASPLFEKIRDNFFLVNNEVVRQGDSRLVFSTLWSWISPQLSWDLQRSLSDFSFIKANGEKFTPEHFNYLHGQCKVFLEANLLSAEDGKTVVVTHHVPTLMNYPAVYKKSPLTDAFAVELFDLIADAGTDHWIYGHHHVNTPAFTIGKTRLVTNQLGYVRHYEHQSFRRDAVLA
jgi:predicted phosphohydrolase